MGHAGRAKQRRDLASFLLGGSANSSRRTGSSVSTSTWRPVSGSTRCSSPTPASPLLPRIADLDGERRMTCSHAQKAAPPVERPAKVGDDDDQAALDCEAADELQRVAGLPPPAGVSRIAPSASSNPRRPRRGRRRRGSPAPVRDDAEAISSSRGHVADRDRHALGDVRLAAIGGAETHRGGLVHHEPGHEQCSASSTRRASGRCGPSRSSRSGDVVPRLVGPHLVELGADAGERGAIVAGHQSVDSATDRQIEHAQALGTNRAGARLGRGVFRPRRSTTPLLTPVVSASRPFRLGLAPATSTDQWRRSSAERDG